MQLTILGNAPAPGPDGAGNSYLVESDTTAILLDCGPGMVGKLVAHRPVSTLTAVVISHTHLDHIYDLPILFLKRYMEQRAVTPEANDGQARTNELRVYLPPGAVATLNTILAAFGLGRDAEGIPSMLSDIVLTEYDPHAALAIGDLSVAFIGPTRHHPGNCYAMRVTDPSGALLAYSGDTSPDPLIVEIARNADCFLCEATMMDNGDLAGQEERHMTARAAGSYATEAHARALVLTHLLNFTPEWLDGLARAARETFAGPVEVARIGHTFTVTAATPEAMR